MTQQTEFSLRPYSRGFHLITSELLEHLPALPEQGLLHLFVKHSSCGLTINENADPDVRTDLDQIMNHLVKEICTKASIPRPQASHSSMGFLPLRTWAKSRVAPIAKATRIIYREMGVSSKPKF